MFARTSLIAAGLALGLSAFISTPAEAHRRWLLPSMTVFSGESATAAVDAASSNQLFVFEHRGMALDNLTVTGPDGQPVQPKIIGSSDLRSAFDVPLTKQGTYRIAVASSGLMGSYELNGQLAHRNLRHSGRAQRHGAEADRARPGNGAADPAQRSRGG